MLLFSRVLEIIYYSVPSFLKIFITLKSFPFKITIDNFGYEIGKILRNFRLGLGPNPGPKSEPQKTLELQSDNIKRYIESIFM